MVPQSSSDGEGEQGQNQAEEVTEEGVVVVTHSDDEGDWQSGKLSMKS